jgi:RadC-like JAB domain
MRTSGSFGDLISYPVGKLLDIEVLDHIVIGLGRFISLKDWGLGF